MKRTTAANLLSRLIDQLETDGINDTSLCLMLTGTWYASFPKKPAATVPLPDGRGIFLLTLRQARKILEVLEDEHSNLHEVAIDIEPKANRAAVGTRHREWERKRIRAIVRRNPGNQTGRYLREGGP